jgi:hypothetical protein
MAAVVEHLGLRDLGIERLSGSYKENVGGSNPSAPTGKPIQHNGQRDSAIRHDPPVCLSALLEGLPARSTSARRVRLRGVPPTVRVLPVVGGQAIGRWSTTHSMLCSRIGQLLHTTKSRLEDGVKGGEIPSHVVSVTLGFDW